MRSTIPSARNTLTTLLIAAASFLSTASLLDADPKRPTTLPADPSAAAHPNRPAPAPGDRPAADDPWQGIDAEPRLHQSFRACGKKWAKKAARLSAEQLDWMLQGRHGFYRVAAAGTPVMTLEILSTPNFKNCEIKTRWDERETTVRLTFYLPDGTTRVRQHNYANDSVYFNQEPKIYAQIGKALLLGVDLDGNPANRWLPIEPAQELTRLARAADDDEPTSVLAAAAIGGPTPVAGFN